MFWSLFEFDIPKRRPIDSLLYDTANIVRKWTEVMAVGATDAER